MVDKWKIPLYKIFTDDEDISLITKIIRRGNNWALGPEIEDFENQLRNYVGSDYCVTVNSGTSALHAVFLAYGLGKDDEIIIPSFSFISTASSILFVNATPRFGDINEDTFSLEPNLIKKSITQNTKAVMPVDYGGLSSNIIEIQKVAEENNLILLEDAAESLGATIQGKKVGSLADSAIFSFCGNKVLTTGEGGAIVTNSREIYEKLKLFRSHGRVDTSNYFDNTQTPEYFQIGYNWRMSSITAALGISQLSKLDKIIKLRQSNAQYLSSRLSKISEISVPNPPSQYEHIYQMYTIRILNREIRDSLQEHLKKKRIFSKVYFEPIHLTKLYRNKFGTKPGTLPVTEKIAEQVLTLPLYPNMTTEEKNYLIDSITEFFESK